MEWYEDNAIWISLVFLGFALFKLITYLIGGVC